MPDKELQDMADVYGLYTQIDLDNHIAHINELLNRSNLRLAEEQIKNNELQKQCDTQKVGIEALEKENAELKKRIKEVENDSTNCEIWSYGKITTLEKENAELNRDKTELVNSVTELKAKVTELEKEIDLYKSLDSHWDEIEEDAKIIAEENTELKEKLKGFENGEVAWQGDMDKTIKQNLELKEELRQKSDTNHSLVEQLADKEIIISELKAQIEKMKCCSNCKHCEFKIVSDGSTRAICSRLKGDVCLSNNYDDWEFSD